MFQMAAVAMLLSSYTKSSGVILSRSGKSTKISTPDGIVLWSRTGAFGIFGPQCLGSEKVRECVHSIFQARPAFDDFGVAPVLGLWHRMVRWTLKERLDRKVKGTIIKNILGAATDPQPFTQDLYDAPTNMSDLCET